MSNKTIDNISLCNIPFDLHDSKSRAKAGFLQHFTVGSVEEMENILKSETPINDGIFCDVISTDDSGNTKTLSFILDNNMWIPADKMGIARDEWMDKRFITFEDEVIEEKMLALCDDDGDGFVSLEESKKAINSSTNSGTTFQNIAEPFYANDLQKFPNLVPYSRMFYRADGCNLQFPFIWKNRTPTISGSLANVLSLQGKQFINENADFDLTGWDVSEVTSLAYAFGIWPHGGWSNPVSTIGTIDVTGWDTSKVTSLRGAVYYDNINEIKGWKDLNTSAVTDLNYLFTISTHRGETLDMSDWDVRNVTEAVQLCNNLYVKNLYMRNWKLKKCTSLQSALRVNLTGELDISGWETSNVRNWASFMAWCYTFPRVVDLTSLDFSSATNLNYVFMQLGLDDGGNVNVVGGKTIDEVRAEGIRFYKNVNISFDSFFASFDAASQLALLNGLGDVNGKTDASGNPITMKVGKTEILLDMSNAESDGNGGYTLESLQNTDFKIALDKGWTINFV